MIEWLAEYKSVWVALHLFALVLGLGGATYSDFLLFKFLSDFKISHKEADIIRSMSKIVMLGLFLATLSGLFLFLPEIDRLISTPKFLAKMFIFTILMLNGVLLHRWVMPKMVHFSFHKEHYVVRRWFNLRRLGFVMGSVSFVSWYSVFLLGAFTNIPYSFTQIVLAYVGTIIVGSIVSSWLECFIKGCIKGKKR